jgi:hypothetical protein
VETRGPFAAVFFSFAIVPDHRADGDVGTVMTFALSLVGLRVAHLERY